MTRSDDTMEMKLDMGVTGFPGSHEPHRDDGVSVPWRVLRRGGLCGFVRGVGGWVRRGLRRACGSSSSASLSPAIGATSISNPTTTTTTTTTTNSTNSSSSTRGRYRNRDLAVMFVSVVALTVILMGVSSDPEIPYKAAEVYMSCLAPRLSSFNSLLSIESQPCSPAVVDAAVDTRLLVEKPDLFVPSGGKLSAGHCASLWKIDDATSTTSMSSSVYDSSLVGGILDESLLDACIEWVTFSTKCSKNLNRLQALAALAGVRLAVLGMHTAWTGFGGRIHTLAQYLRAVPDGRIVIFTDADDVLPLPACSAAHLARTFRAQASPVLFMAERECWPDAFLKHEYPDPISNSDSNPQVHSRPSPFRFLNGGSYIGYAWALRDVIAEAYTIDCSDDQRGFTRVFLSQTSYVYANHSHAIDNLRHHHHRDGQQPRRIYAASPSKGRDLYADRHLYRPVPPERAPPPRGATRGQPYIRLDTHAVLFQSLVKSRIEEFDFSLYNTSGRLTQLLTNTQPCVYHQNGDKYAVEMVLPYMIDVLGFDAVWDSGVSGVSGNSSVSMSGLSMGSKSSLVSSLSSLSGSRRSSSRLKSSSLSVLT